jgi:hypothetical protein
MIYTGMPVIQPSGVSPATNGVIIGQVGNCRIQLPVISGFSGVGINLINVAQDDVDVHEIRNCGISVRMAASNSTYGNSAFCADNTVKVIKIAHDGPAGIGLQLSSDTNGAGMQGNDFYVNFYEGLVAVRFGGESAPFNQPAAWDGTVVRLVAVDCLTGNGGGGSGCRWIQNLSGAAVWRGRFITDGWLGGIAGSSYMATAGKFIDGEFIECEFTFAMADSFSAVAGSWDDAYGTFAFAAGSSGNRCINIGGGGNWAAGYAALQTAAGNRSAFGFSTANRIEAGLVLGSNISAAASQDFYFYTPLGGPSDFEASAVISIPVGLVIEAIMNNCATNPNEYIIRTRNVSGAQINSGTVFGMIITVGL